MKEYKYENNSNLRNIRVGSKNLKNLNYLKVSNLTKNPNYLSTF